MKIAVLGGGISGLSAGWYARKQFPNAQIELYEKTDRLGGWIESTQEGAFLFERGPRTFQRGRSPHLLKLIEEVGLSSQILFSDAKAPRYLWRRGQLRSLNSYWPTILKGCLRDLVFPISKEKEETIAAFFGWRFGKKLAEELIDPMVTGVFGGDMHRLSAKACFPTLTQKRSVVMQMVQGPKRQSGLFTLRGGMQTLIKPLAQAFDQVHFCHATLPDADRIICALSPEQIASLLDIPLTIPMATFSVVNIGFDQEGLLPAGYGYLIPSSENDPVMGMIWDSSIFATPGQTKLTVMVRSQDPLKEAKRALKEHLNITQEPKIALVKAASIPQYEIGHENRVENFLNQVNTKYPSVLIKGNWLKGASVDQCIAESYDLNNR